MFEQEKIIVESAWEQRELLAKDEVREAIRRTVEAVDKGVLRLPAFPAVARGAPAVRIVRSAWRFVATDSQAPHSSTVREKMGKLQ